MAQALSRHLVAIRRVEIILPQIAGLDDVAVESI
jgi:hypothetical protein